MDFQKSKERSFQHYFSIPFIYGMLLPFLLLDICLEIYHRVCFPLYGIPLVKRSRYIRIDRHKLSYLHPVQKLNCAYCGYGNGLLHYASAIAGETERYWCGIKHAEDPEFIPPKHHKDFLPYGDEEAYARFVMEADAESNTQQSKESYQ